MNFTNLEQQIRQMLSASEADALGRVEQVCRFLHHHVEYYNWVGVYFAVHSRKELVLGPFVGEPTDHIRIPFGRGICGQAVQSEETFLIQDVAAQDNYLSCSIHVKSEIVVPVFRGDRVLAEIDIDSHVRDAFSEDDRWFLESVAQMISPLMPDYDLDDPFADVVIPY
ncbi:GAF domain-containing protein [Spirochaeta lutea]|uniref:GAF domain-containing protein n=1 Tax=Spirochaeta lutea TaxID=1480694 RepID=UPI00068A2E35|nr:GAF domain-containing protein [Spirochaeta lutea]